MEGGRGRLRAGLKRPKRLTHLTDYTISSLPETDLTRCGPGAPLVRNPQSNILAQDCHTYLGTKKKELWGEVPLDAVAMPHMYRHG